MNKKQELIIELRNYLEGFIKRYKKHSSLNLLDVSQHLRVIRSYEKDMKKLNKEEKLKSG